MTVSSADGDAPEDVSTLLAREDVSYDREIIDVPPESFEGEGDESTNRYVGCAARNPAGELLLVKHDEDRHKTGWVIPGGAVEPGESFEGAACRELREETGIDCRIRRPVRVTEQVFRNEADHAQTTTGYFVLFSATPESETLATDPGRPGEGIVAVDWFDSVPRATPQPDLIRELLG